MKNKPLILALTSAVVFTFGPAATPMSAQTAVTPLAAAYQPLSDQQLDQLLGPIALYPDPLLAEILPAATFPTDIVLASRYLTSGGDPSQIRFQPWDASVQALAHYPAVLQYLDVNLSWTVAVGQAFLYQRQQVMESIQRLRWSAQNFGNLYSTPQAEVVNDDGSVEILPVAPDVIYVPVYQPEWIYGHSGYGWRFGLGWTFGAWLDGDCDWVHDNIYFWHHHRPANWWHEPREQRVAWLLERATLWQPELHRHLDNDRREHRGGSDSFEPAAEARNNSIVEMSRLANAPRPAAEPRAAAQPEHAAERKQAAEPTPEAARRSEAARMPEAAHNSGGAHVPDRAAPSVTAHGPAEGGAHAAESGSPGGRGLTTAPAHNEPARSESARVEPRHVEPQHIESQHVEMPHAAAPQVESRHVEPPHTEPPHAEPPHAQPAPPPSSSSGSHSDSNSQGSSRH